MQQVFLNIEGEDIQINEIRFLPMSSEIFQTYEDVKEFILHTLPERDGVYYFQKKAMNCPQNTFVLFQYSGQLVGYAIYGDKIIFDKLFESSDGTYRGYYQFIPESITWLNQPITAEEFSQLDYEFKNFTHSMQKKSTSLLPAILGLINQNKISESVTNFGIILPEELTEQEILELHEGGKKQITVNAYERNPRARTVCINHYRQKNGRIKCEVCGFDFGKIYGEKFMEKIHVHHLIEIASIGDEYIIDPIEDLIPICPNCHLIAHSKKPAYTPKEIQEMLTNNHEK